MVVSGIAVFEFGRFAEEVAPETARSDVQAAPEQKEKMLDLVTCPVQARTFFDDVETSWRCGNHIVHSPSQGPPKVVDAWQNSCD